MARSRSRSSSSVACFGRYSTSAALNNVRFNGDCCPPQLIEQGARSRMVGGVALLQGENCGLVRLLPCEKRPVFVHGSSLCGRGQHRLNCCSPHRTSPISLLLNFLGSLASDS